MKKLNYILIIFLIMICGLLFCSYSKNNNKTVRGFIHVYGNDPFTYIGIETEDNKKYTISAEDEIISELRKTQGSKIEITGIINSKKTDKSEPGTLEDGKIQVTEWKYVK